VVSQGILEIVYTKLLVIHANVLQQTERFGEIFWS